MPAGSAESTVRQSDSASRLPRKVRGWAAAGLRSVRGRRSHIVNLGLLVVGLVLGQGTIFVAQTALVAAGEYELLAGFGTHYSFAILGIIVVDAGASITLARAVARLQAERRPHGEVWQMFCDTSVIRLAIAMLLGAAAAIYVGVFAPDGFSRWYVSLALPALLLWAVNGVGVLDGLRLSGVSGITGSATYIVTTIGLVLAVHRSQEAAGAILGGAFSLGYLVTVSAQWIALVRRGWSPRLRGPTHAGLAQALKDGIALSFQIVPGQITMRVQLVLSATYLGAETTALFVYAKQILTAATQIIGFILRVEFPGLVEQMSTARGQSLGSMIGAQKMALFCAVTFAVGATAIAGIAATLPDFSLHRAALIVAGFMPTILTMSLLLMMTQGLAALGAYGAIASALAVSSAAAILASYLLVSLLHVYAFAAAEVVLNAVGLYVGYRYLRRRN